MRELPILFTADMVKASDEGLKTCTRRIIKLSTFYEKIKYWQPSIELDKGFYGYDDSLGWELIKPKYQPGDHLWIKQNFQIRFRDKTRKTVYGYREDDSKFHDIKLTDREWEKFSKWKTPFEKKSKLFMFKTLAYKWIEVISVRAERLQDITPEDIIKEGIIHKNEPGRLMYDFIDLWNSINKSRDFPWESNPYVWVYDYKRIEK